MGEASEGVTPLSKSDYDSRKLGVVEQPRRENRMVCPLFSRSGQMHCRDSSLVRHLTSIIRNGFLKDGPLSQNSGSRHITCSIAP
jgi:hypothetical protein